MAWSLLPPITKVKKKKSFPFVYMTLTFGSANDVMFCVFVKHCLLVFDHIIHTIYQPSKLHEWCFPLGLITYRSEKVSCEAVKIFSVFPISVCKCWWQSLQYGKCYCATECICILSYIQYRLLEIGKSWMGGTQLASYGQD